MGGAGGTTSFLILDSTVGFPGTSYLDDSIKGMCTGLAGNQDNGYVTVTLQ